MQEGDEGRSVSVRENYSSVWCCRALAGESLGETGRLLQPTALQQLHTARMNHSTAEHDGRRGLMLLVRISLC